MKNLFCTLFLLWIGGIGCSKSSYVPGLGIDTPLPTMVSEGMCAGIPSPGLAEWAGWADSVVVGNVSDIRPAKSPAYVTLTGATPKIIASTDCTGTLEAGLLVDLTNVSVMHGSPRGNTLTIAIGREVIGGWFPIPAWENGRLTWIPSNETGRLVSGQRVGATIRLLSSTGKLGPLSTPLFAVDSHGAVRLSQANGCNSGYPDGIEGKAEVDLAADVAAIPWNRPAIKSAIEEQRQSNWIDSDDDRVPYYGAYCHPN